jgi:MOSC domain-containing protein YiiM
MLDTATLDAGLRALNPARDAAPVRLLVQRLRDERRNLPERVTLDPELGVVGDRWAQSWPRKTEAQVTLMRWDVAALMHDEPAIFGDNLFASLDTGAENLPPGTVLQVGQARLEVTPKPHRGCHKFEARAGRDALEITRAPDWLRHQLRGVHLRVLEGGTVYLGDALSVVSRPG